MAIAGLEAAKQENRELNEELDSLRIASPQNHGGPRSVSPTKNQQYETLGRGAGGMKIRRPPPSTSRVLSDATNASSRRTSSSSTLGSRASSGQHGRASQSSTAATSLSSSSAKVSLANVASASKFKAFMR